MTYTIAVASDTHLGYAARCRIHPPSGINERVRDGYRGFRETVDQIIAAEPDVFIHAGDLFHRSHPSIADITWARRQLERLAVAGIPVFGTTGNHDFANERGKQPATAAVNDPDRGITMVTDPLGMYRPVDGLSIHLLSHLGLIAADRAMPEPVDGDVNVLAAHGAAQVPGHPIFACVDSPGEAVIGYDVLTMPWNVTLLGHYHGMNPLPGFDRGDTGQAWYAGSLLRRGFSDPAGGRGWLLVTVHDNGTVSVDRQYVTQRNQFDLPMIDAADLNGSDVEERIRVNLAAVDMPDAIIRQRVVNCPLPVRRAVDTAALNTIADAALTWQLEFSRPVVAEFADLGEQDHAVGSLSTAGSADLPAMWGSWFGGYADTVGMPVDTRSEVVVAGTELLREVSVTAETGTTEITTSATVDTVVEDDPFADIPDTAEGTAA